MITILPSGDVLCSVRYPLVYLDHCAIRGVSSSPDLRGHLLATFQTRGTLMFSVINILEMGKNTGASFQDIASFLDAVGPHFVLSDVDARSLDNARRRGEWAPQRFVAPTAAMFGALFKNMPKGDIQLGAALQAVAGDEFQAAARRPRYASLVDLLRRNREKWRRGERFADPPGQKGDAMWIELSLEQSLIAGGKKIIANDVADLMHAVVPLAEAQIVVLDRTWAEYAQRLKLEHTEVFAVRNLHAALERVRTFDLSAYRVVESTAPERITL